jgi:hypothetical protein
MSRLIFSALLAALLAALPAMAAAKELDQFTDRALVLRFYAGGYRAIRGAPGPERVDAVLDARMNELLEALERALAADPPSTLAGRDRLVREVFQHRYVPQLVTPYEEWIKHDALVPLYKVRDKGIFGHAVDYDDARLTWYIELSPIVQVSGVLMGIDKLGHFLAQGFQYYERHRALPRELPASARYEALRQYGHAQEVGALGIATGGVYSFADLAANWAGMLFFLSLFEDIDAEGDRHARYFVRTESGGYRLARAFHWYEWVSSDWDEVLNPAAVHERALLDKVSDNMHRRAGPIGARRKSICDHYLADPAAFLGPHRPLLRRERYALPEHASATARFTLDIRAICASPPRTERIAQ